MNVRYQCWSTIDNKCALNLYNQERIRFLELNRRVHRGADRNPDALEQTILFMLEAAEEKLQPKDRLLKKLRLAFPK
jgi:hypothetical protein